MEIEPEAVIGTLRDYWTFKGKPSIGDEAGDALTDIFNDMVTQMEMGISPKQVVANINDYAGGNVVREKDTSNPYEFCLKCRVNAPQHPGHPFCMSCFRLVIKDVNKRRETQ